MKGKCWRKKHNRWKLKHKRPTLGTLFFVAILCGVGLFSTKVVARKKARTKWPPCRTTKCRLKILGWNKAETEAVVYRKCYTARYPKNQGRVGGGNSPIGFSFVYEDVMLQKPGKTNLKYLCTTRKKRRRPLYKRSRCRKKLKRLGLKPSQTRIKSVLAKWVVRFVRLGKKTRSDPFKVVFHSAVTKTKNPNQRVAVIKPETILQECPTKHWSRLTQMRVANVIFNPTLDKMAIRLSISRGASSVSSFLDTERVLVFNTGLTSKGKQRLRTLLIRMEILWRAKVPPLASIRCRKSSDCVIRPRGPCSCPLCGNRKPAAINKTELQLLRKKWAIITCPRPSCTPCKPGAAKYRYRAKCVRRKCTVKRYPIKNQK